MGIAVGALAAKAIRWLVRSFKFWRSNKTEFSAALAVLKAAGLAPKILEDMSSDLRKVEETLGAHTSVWSKTDKAKKQKSGLTLTVAEVKYLYAFKRVFDKRFKKRFKR